MEVTMVHASSATSAGTIGLALLLSMQQIAAAHATALADTSPREVRFPLRAPEPEPTQAVVPATTDTAPPIEVMPPSAAKRDATMTQQDACEFDGAFAGAYALLDRLTVGGTLSADRAVAARNALDHMTVWKVPAPTELSDGSDGDFTLIWRRGGLTASLTYTDEDVVGYAYNPRMLAPWMFEQAGISIPELNTLARALG
jgi:hypothetical protein